MKTVFLLTIFFLISAHLAAQQVSAPAGPFLETRAYADSLVNPDILHLEIELSEKSDKVKNPLEAKENQLIEILRSIGIDIEKQVTITDLASNFHRYFIRKGEILLKKNYKVKVYDIQTAGKVFKAMDEIGISEVRLKKSEYSRAEELKLQMRTKAMINAKRQAEALLRPLNQKVLNAILVEENPVSRREQSGLDEVVVDPSFYIRRSISMDKIVESIQMEPIRISSSIRVCFRIE